MKTTSSIHIRLFTNLSCPFTNLLIRFIIIRFTIIRFIIIRCIIIHFIIVRFIIICMMYSLHTASASHRTGQILGRDARGLHKMSEELKAHSVYDIFRLVCGTHHIDGAHIRLEGRQFRASAHLRETVPRIAGYRLSDICHMCHILCAAHIYPCLLLEDISGESTHTSI